MTRPASFPLPSLRALVPALLLMFVAGLAMAQGPTEIVFDLEDGLDATAGLQPRDLAVVGGRVFFTGWHPLTGWEPWVSDGTAGGTRLLIDACPGLCSSSFRSAHVQPVPQDLDGLAYFSACDDLVRCQIWRTSGSAKGTSAITRWSRPGRIEALVAWDGQLYFAGSDGAYGSEPRVSDGTSQGTRLLADIEPGPNGSAVVSMVVGAGHLFLHRSRYDVNEVWSSDGTTDGTLFLASTPGLFTPILDAGERVFFQPLGSLWSSDGSPEGTRQLPLNGGSVFRLLAAGAGRAFYVLFNEPTARDNRLWTTDGTDAGTRFVLFLGSTSFSGVNPFISEEGIFHFTDTGLWRLDESAVRFEQVFDLGDSHIADLLVSDDTTYVGASDGLWSVTGTDRPVLIADSHAVGRIHQLAGDLVLQAHTPQTGAELALFSSGAISQLSDVVEPGSSHARPLLDGHGNLLFTRRIPARFDNLHTLYELDDATGELRGLGDFDDPPVPVGADAATFLVEQDVFRLREDQELELLFDGTSPRDGPGLTILASPQRDDLGAFDADDSTTALGDRLFFLVWNHESYSDSWIELWTSDGTAGGTERLDQLLEFTFHLVCDPPPCQHPSWGTEAVGDLLAVHFGERLWISDTQSGGAVELDHGADEYGDDLEAVAAGERLFFTDGNRLWTWQAGDEVALLGDFPDDDPFVRAVDLSQAVGGTPSLPPLNPPRGTLFFTAYTADTGRELWRSDGTSAGTALVADIRPGVEWSNPRHLFAWDGQLVFAADDGRRGEELWTSDGTRAGTRLLADLNRRGSSHPRGFTLIDGRLYFAADDGRHGLEPWISDGTREGTVLLDDVAAGVWPSSPGPFVASGSRIFFTAGTEGEGFELRALPRTPR